MKNIDLKKLLKDNKIHKSFEFIFKKCDSEQSLSTLLVAYSFFALNKKALTEKECGFYDYFNTFEVITTLAAKLYQESCELIVLENKTNYFINRTIKKKDRYLAYDHNNYNLCLFLVKSGLSLDVFKSYLSNTQHTNTTETFHNCLCRLMTEKEIWKTTFVETITGSPVIPKMSFLIKKKKEILFFSGSSFFIHKEFGATNWCSSQNDDYYHFSFNFMEKVYFYFDFNRDFHDPLSLLAIITNNSNQIIDVFDKFNNKIKVKNLDPKFQTILLKKGAKFNSNITKQNDQLMKSLYYFKEGDKEKSLRFFKEYKENLNLNNINTATKYQYSYFYLLPKMLVVLKSKEIDRYFNMLKEHNLYIISPNFDIIDDVKSFEVEALSNSSIQLIERYLRTSGTELINGRFKNAFIKDMQNKKGFFRNNIVSVLWDAYVGNNNNAARKSLLPLIRNIIDNIKSEYSDHDFDQIIADYVSENVHLDPLLPFKTIRFLTSVFFSEATCKETIDINEIRHIFNRICDIFEKNNITSTKPIRDEVSLAFSLFFDEKNDEFLKSMILFVLNDFELSELLVGNPLITNFVIINKIEDDPLTFEEALKNSLINFRIDENKKIIYEILRKLLNTLPSEVFEEVVSLSSCKKTKEMYLDLIQ